MRFPNRPTLWEASWVERSSDDPIKPTQMAVRPSLCPFAFFVQSMKLVAWVDVSYTVGNKKTCFYMFDCNYC